MDVIYRQQKRLKSYYTSAETVEITNNIEQDNLLS
jgi:hypothetical protein